MLMAQVASQRTTIGRLEATFSSLEVDHASTLEKLRNQEATLSSSKVDHALTLEKLRNQEATQLRNKAAEESDEFSDVAVIADLRAQLRRLQNAVAETKASEQKRWVRS